MRIKCKTLDAVARLKSIAYECVPLVTVMLVVIPMAAANGHSVSDAWLGTCTAWAVVHFVLKISSYPYTQSNGRGCVNPNLESDTQKHMKGQRILHNAVEVLSVYLLFTLPFWAGWLFIQYLAWPWGL